MLLQHPVGGLQIAAVAHHLGEPVVLDLRDIDRGVSGREQGRGSDRAGNLVGQRMHLIAEDRTRIRRRIEIVVAGGQAELVLDLAQDLVAIGLEGIVTGPDLVDDLDAGIVAGEWIPIARPPGRSERTNGVTILRP